MRWHEPLAMGIDQQARQQAGLGCIAPRLMAGKRLVVLVGQRNALANAVKGAGTLWRWSKLQGVANLQWWRITLKRVPMRLIGFSGKRPRS